MAIRDEQDRPDEREGYRGRGEDYTPQGDRYGVGADRNWWVRTSDQIYALAGDEDAKARRDWDHVRQAVHRGRGPKNYKRSDERILEDVNERLTHDVWLDATDIEVEISNGEITLNGFVARREDKRRAEDIADSVVGALHVQNNLRVAAPRDRDGPR